MPETFHEKLQHKAEQDVIEMETRNFKKDLEKYRVEAESKQAEEKRI